MAWTEVRVTATHERPGFALLPRLTTGEGDGAPEGATCLVCTQLTHTSLRSVRKKVWSRVAPPGAPSAAFLSGAGPRFRRLIRFRG